MDDIALMREINRLQEQISALRTIEVGGVWQDWTPTPVTVGSMVYTLTNINIAKYTVIGNVVTCIVGLVGTTSGTESPVLSFTAPINGTFVVSPVICGNGYVYDNSIYYGCFCLIRNLATDAIEVSKNDRSNFTLGTNRQLNVVITYIK